MKFTFFSAFLLSSGACWASEDNTIKTSNLLEVCTRADMHWIDFCNGFFQAAHDAATIQGYVCTPLGVTRTNLVELFETEVTKLISIDSSISEASGLATAISILTDAFPCNN
ncbi:Rap1a/Tai family immunity protein [Aliiroseovarius marinus]|uniref:Rap1a/Tai family immunity protein n=1 Tax=Aliiroseovarius marinus TaxID=2500159 RepID=UPI003B8A6CE7